MPSARLEPHVKANAGYSTATGIVTAHSSNGGFEASSRRELWRDGDTRSDLEGRATTAWSSDRGEPSPKEEIHQGPQRSQDGPEAHLKSAVASLADASPHHRRQQRRHDDS